MEKYAINDSISGEDIKNIRKSLSMTQKEFAEFASCSKRAVENWESKKEAITGPIVTLVELLRRKPELVRRMELPEKKYRMRLFYMYDNMVCSVIDVDEPKRIVKVKNYIDNPIYCAFGVNQYPDFQDYEEFLESRCFPRTRDKMKIELNRLGLAFYDPILIIEKTEGRMAEDHFWIRIER